MPADILRLIFSICFIAAVILMIRMRQMKAVHIYDYQAGLRFNGADYSVLPPGVYFSTGASKPITVVDMRPRQFIIERQQYKDALLSTFMISLGGEVQVCDARLAVTTLKNMFDDSLTIIHELFPLIASDLIVAPGPEWREKLASDFTSRLNRELQPKGMEVREIEISELWVELSQHSIPAAAN